MDEKTDGEVGNLFLSQNLFRSTAKAERVSNSHCWEWAGMMGGRKITEEWPHITQVWPPDTWILFFP